jgi:hypothetical protein
MTPREVDDCSLWEFGAAVQGWNRANGVEGKPKSLSEDEHDALMRKYA